MPNLSVPAVLLLLCCTYATAQYGKLEDRLHRSMKEHEAVGLSVVVVKDGQPIYQKALGLKDMEKQTPLQPEDVFRIASISKSFSATVIMQLIEEKRVSLDDDFGALVGFPVRNPAFPDDVITLRMALSHTSSINDSQGYFNLDVINPEVNPDWRKSYNSYRPGEGYQYCNLNFNMVGAVIERLTGERFDVVVKMRVLSPLGLSAGFCVDSLDQDRFVTLYAYDSGGFRPSTMAYAPRREELADYRMGYATPVFSPTGGLKISAPDLARYMRMHMNSGSLDGVTIISPRSARTMRKPVAKKEGYGLALSETEDLIPGQQLVGHTGSAYGLYSAMFFHPKKKYGFIVVTNGSRSGYENGFQGLIRDVVNVLYEELVQ